MVGPRIENCTSSWWSEEEKISFFMKQPVGLQVFYKGNTQESRHATQYNQICYMIIDIIDVITIIV